MINSCVLKFIAVQTYDVTKKLYITDITNTPFGLHSFEFLPGSCSLALLKADTPKAKITATCLEIKLCLSLFKTQCCYN